MDAQNQPAVLLITSCVIVADDDAVLRDPQSRIHHTLEAIEHWIKIAPDVPKVICDGSNFDFAPVLQEKFPSHSFECLYFQNNVQKVKLQGKGYGEGEIIEYALSQSQLIQASGRFIKCTGKLWVENFSECLSSFNNVFQSSAYFKDVFTLFRRTSLDYVDTRFYISSVEFYKKYFLKAYALVGLGDHRSIEHVFKDIILEHHLQGSLFRTHPVICGVGGGHGKYYKNNVKRRLKDRLRWAYLKVNSEYQWLFAKDSKAG
jgi:hypothetical protein